MTENPSNPIKASNRSPHSDPVSREVAAGSEGVASASNEQLLNRIRRKDQTAMTDVFDRYGRLVYSVALRILKDPTQAEDVMQEIFFQIWRNPDAFVQGRGSLGGWLVVVARNRAIDALRRRKRTDSVDEVTLPSHTNLASETERNTLISSIRVAMDGLPTEQQKLIEMSFFEGLTHSEIAAQTGDPLGTIKTRIRSALITLRKAIQA
jgi:RNA polymerase sigma-70 factor, ECF subfamily